MDPELAIGSNLTLLLDFADPRAQVRRAMKISSEVSNILSVPCLVSYLART